MSGYTIITGDCVERMAELEPNSIDAIVSDPPYGLEFMGKTWDRLDGGDRSQGDGTVIDDPATLGGFQDGAGGNPYTRSRIRYGGKGTPQHNYAGIEPGNDSPHARRHSVSFTGASNPTCRNCGGLRSLESEGSGGRKKCRCDAPDFPDYRGPAMRAMQEWHYAWAVQALRVLKPGGHLLAFGGTRTYHRLACALEDAGFEIRDCITWLYGSGFPKSLDVSKAIDKAAGAEREVVGRKVYADGQTYEGGHASGRSGGGIMGDPAERGPSIETAPATPDAARWDGWGTALKPAFEPIVVARKPLEGTVAANVLKHGTGALNIDGCRIGTEVETWPSSRSFAPGISSGYTEGKEKGPTQPTGDAPPGRWPANVVLSHTEECVLVGTREVKANAHWPVDGGMKSAPGFAAMGPEHGDGRVHEYEHEGPRMLAETVEAWDCADGCPVKMLDEQSGESQSSRTELTSTPGIIYGMGKGLPSHTGTYGFDDQGGASRFYYCAKVSPAERNAGLGEFEEQAAGGMSGRHDGSMGSITMSRNVHPTVKPIAVMRWLLRLVTPPGGQILDPFLGSGSTGCGAVLEGFQFVGIERDPEYVAIAAARIKFWAEHGESALDVVRAREAADKAREVIAAAGQLDLFS